MCWIPLLYNYVRVIDEKFYSVEEMETSLTEDLESLANVLTRVYLSINPDAERFIGDHEYLETLVAGQRIFSIMKDLKRYRSKVRWTSNAFNAHMIDPWVKQPLSQCVFYDKLPV